MDMTSRLRVYACQPVARGGAEKRQPGDPAPVPPQAVVDRNARLVGYGLPSRSERSGGTPASVSASPLAAADPFTLTLNDHGANPLDIALAIDYRALHAPSFLPAESIRLVLEVGDDVTANAESCARLAALHASGCRLAVDARRWSEDWGRLRRMFSVVRIEGDALLRIGGPNDLRVLCAHGARVLAYGLETHSQFKALHTLGVDLFQGQLFSHAERGDDADCKLAVAGFLQLISRIHAPGLGRAELIALVARDASLTRHLLRCMNAPSSGAGAEVRSVEQAVRQHGFERVRGWVTLLAMMTVHEGRDALCHAALGRAHMCERLAREINCGNPEDAFTVGLLSVLDELLEVPIDQIVADLQLSHPVASAVARGSGIYGLLLESAVAVAEHDREAARVGVEPGRLAELRASAMRSAATAFETLAPQWNELHPRRHAPSV